MKNYFILLLFCSLSNLKAQQPASIHLTEKDGLPDIDFYNIIEDSKQFIWLAADNGLYRYDGQNYNHYTHPDQKGNAVFGTLEDDKGLIWCNNISGQFFYAEDKILKLFVDLGDVLNGELSQFKISKNHLMVFTGRTIYTVRLSDKKLTKIIKNNNSLIGSPVKFNGNYFYSKHNQIIKTDESFDIIDSLHIKIFSGLGYDKSMSGYPNLALKKDLFLCYFIKYNANVFYYYDYQTKEFDILNIPNELKNRSINNVFFQKNEIWITTDLGIQIFDFVDKSLEFKKTIFNKINVTKIIKDSKNNYWITTKGDGIFVIPNINIFQYDLPKNLLNINKLKIIRNDNILFGTNNGMVAKLNIFDNKVSIVDSSSAFRVSEIILDAFKQEAIIIKEDIALRLNINNNIKQEISNTRLPGAKSLSKVKDYAYILSSYKDAVLLDENFKQESQLVFKRSYINFFSEKSLDIYIGTVEGLFVFDKDLKKHEITYKSQPILAVSITETIDSIIWVSTFKNGIFGIKNNEVVSHYTTKNGLLSDNIGVIESDKMKLWITSDKGVQLLDLKNNNFRSLTQQNGIPSYRISDIEIKNNQVFFSSNTGIFGLDEHKVFKTYNEKDIYFTNISISNSSKPIKTNYELNYDETKIEFSFNTNGFQSNLYTQYEYRLLGADSIWKTTKELVNSVTYNSLKSGNYVFQVKVLSEEDTLKEIHFTILKPFWNRWWFYVLITILLGIGIYAIFISKIKKLKKKQTEILQKELLNKQLVFSQLENLRSQMNPHFIFNALNSIQEYIVLNEKDLASSYLIKFSRLIRIYLEHSRADEVLLSEEIKALQIYLELEKNRFEDVLDYAIEISESINSKSIKIPSLFIQPYVENALKHGLLHKKTDRKLIIKFYLNTNEDSLICSIEDNGIGVEASKKINRYRTPQHKSFATNANEKRVSLLNTNRVHKIKVETTNLGTIDASGTLVVITIPIEKKNYESINYR